MRHAISPHVADAISLTTRPTLIFDRARLLANVDAISTAARASNITTLFALKSFPHDEVRAIARTRFDGFDAAGEGEVELAGDAAIVSIADPSGRATSSAARRTIVSCETIDHARRVTNAEIAVRVSASITDRDPAIGAILDGATGHRRSRFGVLAIEPELAALATGLHVHHGAVTATSAARFIATIERALALLPRARFVNLGGAWHGIPLASLAEAFAQIRASVPRDIEILVEPGRAIARDAGYAVGAITAERTVGDRRLVVTALSKICHLRWSPAELVAAPPAAGDGVPTVVVGPTCFEEDVLGEWTVAPGDLRERVVVRDVTGYAVAWNCGFGGLPPADVVLV